MTARILAPLLLALGLAPATLMAQRSVQIPPLPPVRVPSPAQPGEDTTGLRFRLSEASTRAAPAQGGPTTVEGERLSATEVERLLRRLSPLRAEAVPEDSFAFPPRTPPPPRTGVTVRAPFPPEDTAGAAGRPETPAVGPLAVARYSPEGEVDVAAAIGVTVVFSQPMVPLSSVEEVAARQVPASLSPPARGRWRWVDVRTLRFEPQGRLPMATRYTVEVPAGARSATGGVLREAVRWSFSTPAPRATGAYPHGRAAVRHPVLLIAWDQRVDPATVLPTVRVRAGREEVPLRLATAEEIAADPEVSAQVGRLEPGRWTAFRPVRPLPADAAVQVSVGPGTPSAEGPLLTETVQEWSFRTYGPLRVTDHRCGWREECRPGEPWSIRFSTPLDPEAWSDSLVRVEPAVAGLEVQLWGEGITLRGRSLPQTTYRVRLRGGIRDRFGQTLGRDTTLTFRVGSPTGRLWSAGEDYVVLDPEGPRFIPVYSHDFRRLRVRVHLVDPRDWPAYVESRQRGERGRPLTPPGRQVFSRVVEVGAAPGEMTETRIDLSPALPGGLGHAVVVVEPVDPATDEERWQRVSLWVQSTRIGLTALADPRQLVGWATSLVDGRPLSGAQVTLSTGAAGQTDREGLATLPLPAEGGRGTKFLVARLGSDAAILPEQSGRGGWGGWTQRARPDALAWYVFTDRHLYRPGEEVRFKGWVRRLQHSEDGALALPRGGAVRFVVMDPEGNELHRGTLQLTPLGGFDQAVTLPREMRLGWARIRLEMEEAPGVQGARFDHTFQVQEFRRPEYTVEATGDPGPHFVGGSAVVRARAAYYAGGGLPGAEVRWTVRATPADFTPPNWDRWTFGGGGGLFWGHRPTPPRVKTLEGRTDAEGVHALRIDFEGADPPRTSSVEANATVVDVNRQTWTTGTRLLVHPAAVYAGLRTERSWLPRGTPLQVDVVVVDLDGNTVEGRPVEVRAIRTGWRRSADGTWREVEDEPQVCRIVSAAHPGSCTFRTEEGGVYRVVALVRDAEGRPSQTETRVWVSGAEAPERPETGEEREVALVADREEYRPGQTAEILLRAPFFPARGVVSVVRSGIERTEAVSVQGPTHVLRVPIGEADVPNVHVRVELVGASGGGGEVRGTDFASGSLELSVPPRQRTLRVVPTPRDTTLLPGGRTVVEVEVHDADGRPVRGAEVALVVVDEAVLALSGYRLPDPIATFYPKRYPDVRVVRTRPHVLLAPRDFEPAPRTLVGRVVDASTGMPLGGAAVAVEGTDRRAVTDAYGRFRITDVSPGTYTVRVTRAGHGGASQTVRVGTEAPEALRFALVSEEAQVEGLVVTASDFSGVGVAGGPPPPPPPPAPPAPAMAAPEARMAREGGREEPAGPAIEVRADFDPLAAFVPAARTDARGRVEIPVELPSNLTRYRVVAAVVAEATHYGLGESAITARQPLMVRPSAPRFLNFGDRFSLPVVLQNQTGAPLEVEVAVRAAGLALHDAGRRVTVPAHDRVEVRFPAATLHAGTARLQVAAASGALADAAELSLPVWTPATAEAFATYGTVDSGAEVLPVRVPEGVLPGFGGLEVTTSSTALQELTDALIYLVRYPFECSEQIASRVLAVAALRDVLTAFRAEGLPPPEELAASVERDLAALAALQNPDGGWGFWRRGDPSWPFVTAHVAHALQRAREKGYRVPEGVQERAASYLQQVDRHAGAEYPPRVRNTLEAYALYVRGRMGDRGAASEAAALVRRVPADSLTVEAEAWLLHTVAGNEALRPLAGELLRRIHNRATETAATATFATAYGEGEYLVLHSSRRDDGVVLEALIAADPQSDLIPKVVRGLLAHRTRGRWQSTQENAWVLLALDRYFATYERQTPEFVAGVWLGGRYAGGHRFTGRTTERHHLDVPMRVLPRGDTTSLTLGKEGQGRMYYRAGMRYAPADLTLVPAQHGFAVERTYEAADDPAEVRRGADGVWRVRPGARVRVTVTLTAPARRHHVALVDPLPAGFEPVNPELRGTEEAPPAAPGRPGISARERTWWRWRWWQHQNLRDDRAEAFTTLLPAGTYTYSYIARATTPGIFVVPPPRAEEMYHPETFGRGGTEWVRVEEP